jgi:hypothetical protein
MDQGNLDVRTLLHSALPERHKLPGSKGGGSLKRPEREQRCSARFKERPRPWVNNVRLGPGPFGLQWVLCTQHTRIGA